MGEKILISEFFSNIKLQLSNNNHIQYIPLSDLDYWSNLIDDALSNIKGVMSLKFQAEFEKGTRTLNNYLNPQEKIYISCFDIYHLSDDLYILRGILAEMLEFKKNDFTEVYNFLKRFADYFKRLSDSYEQKLKLVKNDVLIDFNLISSEFHKIIMRYIAERIFTKYSKNDLFLLIRRTNVLKNTSLFFGNSYNSLYSRNFTYICETWTVFLDNIKNNILGDVIFFGNNHLNNQTWNIEYLSLKIKSKTINKLLPLLSTEIMEKLIYILVPKYVEKEQEKLLIAFFQGQPIEENIFFKGSQSQLLQLINSIYCSKLFSETVSAKQVSNLFSKHWLRLEKNGNKNKLNPDKTYKSMTTKEYKCAKPIINTQNFV